MFDNCMHNIPHTLTCMPTCKPCNTHTHTHTHTCMPTCKTCNTHTHACPYAKHATHTHTHTV